MTQGGLFGEAEKPANPQAPHVVMVVANDISADTRVRKMAVAVRSWGARVTVIGVAPDGIRSESELGGAQLVRIALTHPRRQRRAARRSRWHAGNFSWAQVSAARQPQQRDRLARWAWRATQPGAAARSWRLLADAYRTGIRGAGWARRRLARVVQLGYKAYDRFWQSRGWFVSPRRTVPEVVDTQLQLGPVLDALQPDLIHAHDMHYVADVAQAVARARAQGRPVRWLYDAHEWVPGLSHYGGRTARVVAAWARWERRWVRDADAMITVSPPLARALQRRHHRGQEPTVVANVPEPLPQGSQQPAGIREVVGLAADVPLLAYSGGVQAARGVDTAVAALAQLPQAHLAVVAVPHAHTPAVQQLAEQARRLGVADRLHLLDPVPSAQVSQFLASADVGLIPLRHFGSHDMALTNKLFEYLYAGVPLVVSDCRAQAEFVQHHQLGAVHAAGDAAGLAHAVTEVLANASRYRAATTDPAVREAWTWQRQREYLRSVYTELVPPLGSPAEMGSDPVIKTVPNLALPAPMGSDPVINVGLTDGVERPCAVRPHLVIGPANSAGQGGAWAQAVQDAGAGASAVAIRNGSYDYPATEVVTRQQYLRDIEWQLRQTAQARLTWTHALLEAGRPLLGGLAGRDALADSAFLANCGVQVGWVFHGSEVRDPAQHRRTHDFSPFADARDPWVQQLQRRYNEVQQQLERWQGPIFASTPDQLAYLPGRAQWLPVVLNEPMPAAPPPLQRAVPVVVHAPSRPRLKGTPEIMAALEPLADSGTIDLRVITGLAPAAAAAAIADADIVVDQVGLGLYGVLAVQALAAGRVVLSDVGADLRSRVPSDIPIHDITSVTVAAAVRHVLDDRESALAIAQQGPAYVQEFHDGRYSAAILLDWMSVPLPA